MIRCGVGIVDWWVGVQLIQWAGWFTGHAGDKLLEAPAALLNELVVKPALRITVVYWFRDSMVAPT